MKAGEKFPPIDVFFDGEDYWLADGFHRIQAYVMAVPGEAIECNVFKGTQQDAQWYSYSVNKTHGLRRTNADKIGAVKAALTHAEQALTVPTVKLPSMSVSAMQWSGSTGPRNSSDCANV